MNKQYEIKNKRQTILDAARAAVDAGDMDTYSAKMREVADLNNQLAALESLVEEETRFPSDPVNAVKMESKDARIRKCILDRYP